MNFQDAKKQEYGENGNQSISMSYVNMIPRPPWRPKGWPQPQTTISVNPYPVQHFPQGPIQK